MIEFLEWVYASWEHFGMFVLTIEILSIALRWALKRKSCDCEKKRS